MEAPIYLDHHATTPVDARVLEAMLPALRETFGNPDSRAHAFGRRARELVETARVSVASLVGARADEIVFTSGATESNVLAIHGVVRARDRRAHVITQATEHRSVLDAVRALEPAVDVSILPVDREGRLPIESVADAMREDTALVTVMLANNEIGTVHDVAAIGALCRERGVAFHCDASQGLGYLPFDVRRVPVDFASLSAHKMYGPKGAGALFVRRFGPTLAPLVPGGGQERGLRSGTIAVPSVVGFGRAATIAKDEGASEAARLATLRDRLAHGLSRLPAMHVHGAREPRHPGNLHVRFDAVTSEALLLALGDELAFSSGSACATVSAHPSHVLRAIGLDEEQARSGLRFGVGRFTTEAEVDRAVARIVETVEAIRARSSLWGRSP